MSLWDDRLVNGLKALDEYLKPLLQDRLHWNSSLDASDLVSAGNNEAGDGAALVGADETRDSEEAKEIDLPTILERSSALPPYSVLLGICDDGLPFLFDLSNPAPGAMLIAADSGSGKTALLRCILASAASINPAYRVSFNLIVENLEEYADLIDLEHCQQALSCIDPSSADIIEDLCLILEDRRRNRLEDPAIIFAIDDLADLLQSLNTESFARFYGLIKHGPRYRIWTLATLRPEQAHLLDPRLLAGFRTRIVGAIRQQRSAAEVSGDDNLDTCVLEGSASFLVPYGDEWLRIYVCKTQE